MKKWLAVFLFAAVAVSAAETLTKAERDKAVAELEGSRRAFLDATKGLSEAQWNFKPSPERWSVAECAQHIAMSEKFIFGLVTDKVMMAPANPEKRDAAKGKDETIVTILQDRSHKATAPEPIDPRTKPMAPQESLQLFNDSRAHTIDYIKTTQDDLRNHIYDHPVPAIGTLDAYQWIMLISGHTRRHTAQLLEVKADPNFPKK
jgi:hypothetical protein